MEDYSYDVMTEEQAQQERFSLLREGVYDACIEKFEGKLSSNGNRMIVFDLNVYDENGNMHSVKDFIALTSKMTWKLRHHCVSAGLEKEFMDKTWRPHLSIGKMVKVKIIVQPGQEIPFEKLNGKPTGSTYPSRNSVDDYISDAVVTSAKNSSSPDPSDPRFNGDLNDDLPF